MLFNGKYCNEFNITVITTFGKNPKHPLRIHLNVWQKPQQYYKVESPIKINKLIF